MDREIRIFYRHGSYKQSYPTKSFVFSGGELQVGVSDFFIESAESLYLNLLLFARIQSSDDLMRLVLAREALRQGRFKSLSLFVPYFPYARQDRVMNVGEAFSLKAVARIINSLGFDEITTCDPHSDVTPALVDRMQIVSQAELVRRIIERGALYYDGGSNLVIVSPDAGAAKKAFEASRTLNRELVCASKVRDTKTGEISGVELNSSIDLSGRSALIVDDICDGGRTFVELAKVLRERGASKVYLYVTHGIFSKGLGVFEGLIDAVFTTNSFLSPPVMAPEQQSIPLEVLDIEP